MKDRNDKAIELFLNGQFKNMRDQLNKVSTINKLGVETMQMSESLTNNYNNRPDTLIKQKNLSNIRRLSHITDQE